MIKVLHIFSRMNRGGAEMRTLELMPLMASKRVYFDFCTLSPEKSDLETRIHDLGGEIYRCPIKKSLLQFSRDFQKLLRQNNYDIVHSHVHLTSGYIVWLAYRAGIPGRIVHFRNTRASSNDKLHQILDFVKLKLAKRYSTGILAVCKGAMEAGWGKNWKKDKRAKVIYNGLDLSSFVSTPNRVNILNEFDIPENSCIFIHVGSMYPQKNHALLIDSVNEALKKKPSIHLLLVGDGILRKEIEKKIDEYRIGRNVHLLGLRDDVPQLLQASDYFVLSSKWEGLPGVVLEAVAAGLPVIATDLPGVREIAEYTDSINIVPVNDKDALSKAILDISENTGSSQKVEKFPEVFSLSLCADELYEFYCQQITR